MRPNHASPPPPPPPRFPLRNEYTAREDNTTYVEDPISYPPSLPPPRPPPPPPPLSPLLARNFSRNSLGGDQQEDDEYDSDIEWNNNNHCEETPLVGHGARKSCSSNNTTSSSIFRNKGAQAQHHQPSWYSAISERSGVTTDDSLTVDDEESYKNNGNKSKSKKGRANGDDDGYDYDDDEERSVISFASTATYSTITNFRESLLIPFTDQEGTWPKIAAGLAALSVVGTFVGLCMPKNKQLHGIWSPWYRYVSSVIGYNYFCLWSVCFYPQIMLNCRRQSTRGLSNDFAVLNFMGWAFYSSYISSMYFDHEILELYQERFAGESTVQSNDVAFSIHAMILSFVYLVQIVYYGMKEEDSNKSCCTALRLKPQTWVLVLGMAIPSAVIPVLIMTGIWKYERWLDYFYMLSFFKICCTLTKYSKQVWLNYARQSTSGWNIWYNFLECTGGTLSMMQIVLDSVDMQDITGITGNVAKFALGFVTICFDAIFFTQHYILYKPIREQQHHVQSMLSSSNIPMEIKASDRFTITLSKDEEDNNNGNDGDDDDDDNENLDDSVTVDDIIIMEDC